MIEIHVPSGRQWDEEHECFLYSKEQTLRLEHSLVSISKWESKWHIPFIDNKDISNEQMIDYFKCMTLTQNVDPNVYYCLTKENIKEITDYITDPMTATWFSEKKNKSSSRQKVTSELIYYWMISLQIPFECEKWHLNRLITLIKVCNESNAPKKKMSKREIMERNRALNAARRQTNNTRG